MMDEIRVSIINKSFKTKKYLKNHESFKKTKYLGKKKTSSSPDDFELDSVSNLIPKGIMLYD